MQPVAQPIANAVAQPASRAGEVLNIPVSAGGIFFQFLGLASNLYGFAGHAGKSLKAHSWKFIDHGSKAVSKLGEGITKIGFIVQSVGGFVPAASTASAALKIAVPVLVGVGVALSGTALFNDLRNAHKIRQFQKQFRSVQRDWEAGVQGKDFKEKDAAFKELMQLIETTRPGVLRKSLGVKKEALQDLMQNMYRKHPRDQEITTFFHRIDKRTSEQKRLVMINVAFDVVGLVSSIFLIIPVLQPAGFVLIGISLVGSAYNIYYEVYEGYKFEEEIGLINSRHSKQPMMDMKEYALQKFGISALVEQEKVKEKPVQKRAQPELAARKHYQPPKRVRYA